MITISLQKAEQYQPATIDGETGRELYERVLVWSAVATHAAENGPFVEVARGEATSLEGALVNLVTPLVRACERLEKLP